jgi:1-acyl-sn-glycerol-3-phosphate acyltransferase
MGRPKTTKIPVPNVLQRIHGYWFFVLLGLGFIILFPWFAVTLSHKKMYPAAHFGRKIWGWFLMTLSGLWLKVEFEDPYDRKKTYVVVANHTSYVDIPAITCGLPGYMTFMAKAELAKIPVFGRFFRTIDIGVDRKNPHDAAGAFKLANKRLHDDGTSIVIFPEGTIGPWVPDLGRFKDGPFKAAINTQAYILPITFGDNWLKVPEYGPVGARPGRLRMYVHRAIPTAHLKTTDAEELKQNVFHIIENKLNEYTGKR